MPPKRNGGGYGADDFEDDAGPLLLESGRNAPIHFNGSIQGSPGRRAPRSNNIQRANDFEVVNPNAYGSDTFNVLGVDSQVLHYNLRPGASMVTEAGSVLHLQPNVRPTMHWQGCSQVVSLNSDFPIHFPPYISTSISRIQFPAYNSHAYNFRLQKV